jgi:hypothetical protein
MILFFFSFNETWIKNTDDSNLNIRGFICDHTYGNKKLFRKRGRASEGITVYFKNEIKNYMYIKIFERTKMVLSG